MYMLLRQRRLRWLGHVCCMEDGRIPKDIFYGELASGKRPQGRPQLRYKDVCKCNMKALDINTEIWEDTAANRSNWRCLLKKPLKTAETATPALVLPATDDAVQVATLQTIRVQYPWSTND
ncbi:hypothetical protein SRHO_G00106350 [Serrasalmus rhombeus]